MIVAAAATLLFLLLHAVVARRSRGAEFHVQFKLSRGLASIALTAIGFYALWRWWPLWPQVFLDRHARDSVPYLLVCVVSGHFIADFLLLLWGAWRRRSTPRPDLIAHHVIGLGMCAVVFHYQFGYVLFAVALTAEIMPVTSGLAALALWRGQAALERLATQLRLAVLALWRLPLWSFILATVAWRMAQGETDSLMALGHRFTFVSVALVMLLDIYWTRLCVKSLAPARAGSV